MWENLVYEDEIKEQVGVACLSNYSSILTFPSS